MNRTWTILLCALCLTGCRSFQATPKPQQGGRLLATIPPVARPSNVTGVEWTNAPVEINLVAPENPSQQTRTTYTRHSTLAGVEESLTSELAPVQADEARLEWAKGQTAAAQAKAFMDGIRWLPLLGLLPLGLLVFSLTPYGKVMALSKEGRVLLIGASLFLFVAPAISKSIVDNAMVLIILTAAGVAGYVLWERKTAYKIEAAKRGVAI